jgi:hypothetical protein
MTGEDREKAVYIINEMNQLIDYYNKTNSLYDESHTELSEYEKEKVLKRLENQ